MTVNSVQPSEFTRTLGQNSEACTIELVLIGGFPWIVFLAESFEKTTCYKAGFLNVVPMGALALATTASTHQAFQKVPRSTIRPGLTLAALILMNERIFHSCKPQLLEDQKDWLHQFPHSVCGSIPLSGLA